MRARELAEGGAEPPFGVNLFGFITGNLGLGVAARNTARVLGANGVPTAMWDLDPGGGRSGHDTTYCPPGFRGPVTMPFSLNLFHVNPPELVQNLGYQPEWAVHDRLSATVPFWEFPALPPIWVRVFDAMDIILTPTKFVEDAITAALPDARCIRYRQAAFIPDGVTADRARWGLPPDATVFVSSFDMRSDIERKNPEAVVRAFQLAFEGRDDVCLVLKVNSPPPYAGISPRFDALERTLASDGRARLVAERLSYRDVLSLYSSSDVLVSLHRSEGLGLSLMEAMALGVPVIATGWSGNTDFMTPLNSRSVDFRLTTVESDHPAYRRLGSMDRFTWADPDVADCAHHMRELADDPALRNAMGKAAHDSMAQRRAEVEGGEIIDLLSDAMSPDSPVFGNHHLKRRKFRSLARRYVARRRMREFGAPAVHRLRRLVGRSTR